MVQFDSLENYIATYRAMYVCLSLKLWGLSLRRLSEKPKLVLQVLRIDVGNLAKDINTLKEDTSNQT